MTPLFGPSCCPISTIPRSLTLTFPFALANSLPISQPGSRGSAGSVVNFVRYKSAKNKQFCRTVNDIQQPPDKQNFDELPILLVDDCCSSPHYLVQTRLGRVGHASTFCCPVKSDPSTYGSNPIQSIKISYIKSNS